jgi:hypothetical protein
VLALPDGNSDDPLDVGFRIRGIPATFSVITEARLPKSHFNIQIESYPPEDMDYLYHDQAISIWALLDLIKRCLGQRRIGLR